MRVLIFPSTTMDVVEDRVDYTVIDFFNLTGMSALLRCGIRERKF